jgi:L,D-transpeptidase YbiS
MIWKSIIALILIGVLTTLGYFAFKPLQVEKSEWSSISDSLKTDLPDDPALARKEIFKVQQSLQSLRPKGRYIVIDSHSNHLTYRTEDSVLFRATCSTGSGGVLVDSATGRKWTFMTPHGIFKIKTKIEHPWWRKPDWHYIEEKEEIPTDPSQRFDSEVLGDYAMGFGDGYFIHGTLYKRLLGISVTHGCVRLGDDELKELFKVVPIGTPVYIF